MGHFGSSLTILNKLSNFNGRSSVLEILIAAIFLVLVLVRSVRGLVCFNCADTPSSGGSCVSFQQPVAFTRCTSSQTNCFIDYEFKKGGSSQHNPQGKWQATRGCADAVWSTYKDDCYQLVRPGSAGAIYYRCLCSPDRCNKDSIQGANIQLPTFPHNFNGTTTTTTTTTTTSTAPTTKPVGTTTTAVTTTPSPPGSVVTVTVTTYPPSRTSTTRNSTTSWPIPTREWNAAPSIIVTQEIIASTTISLSVTTVFLYLSS